QSLLSVTFPFTVRVTLAIGEELFGIANAAGGAAILLASLLSGRLKHFLKIKYMPHYMLLMSVAVIPIAIVTMLPPENYLLPFLLLVLGFMMIMFIFTFVNIVVMTHAQTHVPAPLVGKSIGIISSIANLATPIGQFILGGLIENLAGLQFALYFGIALITLALAAVARKAIV
ncbi:MAG: hypothetical protein FWE09_08195, partial [Treponema sp.]|nr:hypothetical protein [Treponema sp.]